MTTVVSSRVARKPIQVPKDIQVTLSENDLVFKGPKGTKSLNIHPLAKVSIDNGLINVVSNNESGYCRSGSGSKLKRSITGTTRAIIANIVRGVSTLFERKLILVGVGYKAQMKGKMLSLTLGHSHPIEYPVPEGVTIETPTQTEILIKGVDVDLVGLVASVIREYRGPEPYKGKGIRYEGEQISIKETKKK